MLLPLLPIPSPRRPLLSGDPARGWVGWDTSPHAHAHRHGTAASPGGFKTSPHSDLVLSSACLLDTASGLKVVAQSQNPAGWSAALFPNATSHEGDVSYAVDCSAGCLFNVTADPGEHVNLATTQVSPPGKPPK
jgi:hypothetical protein